MPVRRLLLLCFIVTSFGCAPSVSPLYRDYDVVTPPDAGTESASIGRNAETTSGAKLAGQDVYARIRVALADAGWVERPPVAPNAISTEPRQLSNWGLYRVLVSLDVVPVGDRHVRVFFHPVRRYFTGSRSKIFHLDGAMQRALLTELNATFEVQGLYPIGTPRERDEDRVAGT
jgi:hypothetical protein